ncbi:MAG: hypothetical protein KDB27_33320 [Planctomycetales bacterium]|nr:hypothetical protein [Planctomycetales bacterium]
MQPTTLLAKECLECLNDEHTFLDKLCASLEEIRQSLLQRELAPLGEVLATIPTTPPAPLSNRYRQIRRKLAEVETMEADQVTLDHLAKFVHRELQFDVWQSIRDLRKKRRKAALMNRSNLAVAAVLSRFVDRFFLHAAGTRSSSTYQKDGVVVVNPPGNQIERSA